MKNKRRMERGELGMYDADRAQAQGNRADQMLNDLVSDKLKIKRIKQKRGMPEKRRKSVQWVGDNVG